MTIGIFDSGNGGRFVEEKLATIFPQTRFMRVADTKNAPYGERTYAEVARLCETAIQPLLAQCPIIIIACNTATVAAIESLRKKYPDTTFLGFEPMIKPAANLTKTNQIILLATRATATSPRTRALIKQYASGITVNSANTVGWATAIDTNKTAEINLDEVRKYVALGSDVIILGCTHYAALEETLSSMFPNVTILEPTAAVARQLTRVIAGRRR